MVSWNVLAKINGTKCMLAFRASAQPVYKAHESAKQKLKKRFPAEFAKAKSYNIQLEQDR